jgi:hypothetical protein
VLAKLLQQAGWTPTPELSGVFKPGMVFSDDGVAHRVLTSTCFELVSSRLGR